MLIGVSLHAADRLRQGKAVSDLERWLLDVLRAALPEQEIKDWGRVYREAVQALGEQVAVVPPVISGRPVGTGFALTDLGLVLPAVGQEHAALPNTSIVDREAIAAGKNVDSSSFVQALPSYGFGATVFQRPRRVSSAAHDPGDQSQLGAERAPAPTFRVKLELESFRCRRAGGGKDEIYWASSTGSDKQSGVGFISQEFGKMKVNETGTFDASRRTVFEGLVSEGLVLSLSCWEADQSPPAWARALQTALTEMSDRIFSHWGWALAGMLPGGYTEMLVGLAAEIAGMFAWVVNHVRNEDDLSCARVILLDQYDLALMARGKLRTWDFNGDGHHLLTVKYSGDMVALPRGSPGVRSAYRQRPHCQLVSAGHASVGQHDRARAGVVQGQAPLRVRPARQGRDVDGPGRNDLERAPTDPRVGFPLRRRAVRVQRQAPPRPDRYGRRTAVGDHQQRHLLDRGDVGAFESGEGLGPGRRRSGRVPVDEPLRSGRSAQHPLAAQDGDLLGWQLG
ncbi:hypothetical protein ACGFNV_35315 [Streptomyces sp. NPDC048751]|uniref:hypothetical protein n=1 Tax=Streptomyces sp. NPDC048751 TaxID=3365591 RepID=UPI003715FAA0